MELNALKSSIINFCKEVDGNVTVETVVWTPVMAGILMLVTDATVLMHNQTALYDAARDASRQVVVGAMNVDSAATSIEGSFKESAAVTADVQINGEYVKSTVSMPFSSVVKFSSAIWGDKSLNASTVMWVGTVDEVAASS